MEHRGGNFSMANQPKKYKKFVATAATATLVASAIVPVASAAENNFTDISNYSADVQEAINALVEEGVINATSDTFNPGAAITRGQVVKMLGKLVEQGGFELPEDWNTEARFTDLAVNAKDQELVKYAAIVADAGVFTGNNGVLNASGKITRENMALVLNRAYEAITGTSLVELADGIENQEVSDLATAKAEAQDTIQALKNLGITTPANFNPKGDVTRANFAAFLYRAITVEVTEEVVVKSVSAINSTTLDVALETQTPGLTADDFTVEVNGKEVTPTSVKEVNGGEKYTIVIADLKGTSGTLSVNGKSTDFDYALPVVSAVTAASDKTLTITGTGLKSLLASDVTVGTNTVASISAAADGKSATVTLSSSLIPGQDTKVTVKDSVSSKEYTVNYKLEVATVELVSATFDDDLANQKVQLKVNGSLVTADYLALSGYSVNFVAVEKTKPTLTGVALFSGATNQSSTGILNTGLTVGAEYEVEVQVAKAGVATISAKGTVKIANVHAQAQTIDSVRFVNAGTTGTVTSTFDATVKGTGLPAGDDFFMNSKTVVAGEVFNINNAVITQSGEKTAVAAITDVKVTSSNPAVLSVNATTRDITAEAAGTATISVEIGGVKQDYTFTVTNEKRKLTKVTSKDATVNVIKGNAAPVNVVLTAVDQYGDPFGISSGTAATSTSTVTKVDEVIPTKADGVTPLYIGTGLDIDTTVNSTTVKYGTFVLPIVGSTDVNAGSGTVYIKNKAGQTVGAFVLNVTDVNNTASLRSTIINKTAVGYSSDNALELTDDSTVRFELSKYNSQSIYAGALDLTTGTADHAGPYVISVVNPEIANVKSVGVPTASGSITATGTDAYYEVVGLKTGTTDVLVKDTNGVVVAKETITVTNNPYKISNVSWKQVPTIDFATKVLKTEDVLSLTPTTNDAIVEGITLNKSTTHKVRIATGSITDGIVTFANDGLYVDTDGNGSYTTGEAILGRLVAVVTSGSKLSTSTYPTSTSINALTATGTPASAAGDEATIIFKVMTDDTDTTTSIASTTVNVKVGN